MAETVDSGIAAALSRLRSTVTVRERCRHILDGVSAGGSRWFTLHEQCIELAINRVASLTLIRFPDLRVPYHSRWRHFEALGVDRHTPLRQRMLDAADGDSARVARATIDLAVISVLLDAGAGDSWRFPDPATGQSIGRSEGLALASLAAFEAGCFSSDPEWPWQVDACALAGVDVASLAERFHVSAANPLVGLEGRVQLLTGLGTALTTRPDLFGGDARPGGVFDALTGTRRQRPGRDRIRIGAHDILAMVLDGLSSIWPSGQRLCEQPLGDCWPHRFATLAGDVRIDAGRVPFHKLSQWLCYSLIEPFEWAGIDVDGLDSLTGLPEYRNGGLLIDTGVLVPTAALLEQQPLRVDSEAVIEWRACTVALLDAIASGVRDELTRRCGRDQSSLPLASILEGGTWAAGRQTAQEQRGGLPPLAIQIDGTVF